MTIMTLWQPILASAVITFIAGAVIWMAMPWHKRDWRKTPDEEAVRAALNGTDPGMYSLPHCDPAQFKDPEMQQKFKDGPQAFITVLPIWISLKCAAPLATFGIGRSECVIQMVIRQQAGMIWASTQGYQSISTI